MPKQTKNKQTKNKETEIKNKPELVMITTDPNMFTLDDKKTMKSLWKIAALSNHQVNQVIDLYRKYVNARQPVSRDCSGCGGELSRLYDGLQAWFSKNEYKFPNG